MGMIGLTDFCVGTGGRTQRFLRRAVDAPPMVDFQSRDRTRSASTDPEDSEQRDERDESTDGTDHGAETELEHDHEHVADVGPLGIALVTVSSTRTLDADPSGDAIQTLIAETAHEVVTRELLRDNRDAVQSAVNALADRTDVDVVITTGGTGVTPDDVTVDAVGPLVDKRLPGFGELFRRRSAEEIGTRTIASRATAGVIDRVLVFCLPGSEDAVRLATEEIILEELDHLAGLVQRE